MDPAVVFQNISKQFNITGTKDGIVNALCNVSFSVPDASCTVIGGANGSGKSVLMSIAAGLSSPTSGRVLFPSGKKTGLVFQEADTQILGETPLEDVMFAPKNQGKSKKECLEIAESALRDTGLIEKKDFPARFLSGGEKRRLAAAAVLATGADLIIFDEPYANLDYDGVKQVNSLVRSLLQRRIPVIILTHEMEKCLALASRLIVLYKGHKVFDGTVEEGLSSPLESWGIRNPLVSYKSKGDLIWQ